MITRLNHIAIAVKDLADAAKRFGGTLGAKVSEPVALPNHGVRIAFVELANTTIELIEPLGDDSPIANFLAKHKDGAIHHLCFEVEDIFFAKDKLIEEGARILGDGSPKQGAHGKPVLFLSPKDFCGVLIELEEG